jgi:hypothetical protein
VRPESKRAWDRRNLGPLGLPPGLANRVTEADVARMRRLRADGLRLHEIAPIVGHSASTVGAYLRGRRVVGRGGRGARAA